MSSIVNGEKTGKLSWFIIQLKNKFEGLTNLLIYPDKPELKDFIMSNRPKGIDRIVPLGKTLNFSLIWDGYDLIYSMSRKI